MWGVKRIFRKISTRKGGCRGGCRGVAREEGRAEQRGRGGEKQRVRGIPELPKNFQIFQNFQIFPKKFFNNFFFFSQHFCSWPNFLFFFYLLQFYEVFLSKPLYQFPTSRRLLMGSVDNGLLVVGKRRW